MSYFLAVLLALSVFPLPLCLSSSSIKIDPSGLATLNVPVASEDSHPTDFLSFKGSNCRELPILPPRLSLHCYELTASGRTCVASCPAKFKLSVTGPVQCSVLTGWADLPTCQESTQGLVGCGASSTNAFLNDGVSYLDSVLEFSHIAETWDYAFVFHQASFVINSTHFIAAGRQKPFNGVALNSVGTEPTVISMPEWTANDLPSQISKISYGFYHLLILTANMEVYGFGLEVKDSIYYGSTDYSYVALYKIPIPTSHGYPVSVYATGHSSFVTLSSGMAYYSGDNGYFAALGSGSKAMISMPEGDTQPEFGSNSAYNALIRTASGRFYFRGVVSTVKYVDREDHAQLWVSVPAIDQYDVLTFGHNTDAAILILTNGGVMVSQSLGKGFTDATVAVTALCPFPTRVFNGHDLLYVTGECGGNFALGYVAKSSIAGFEDTCLSTPPSTETFFKMPDVPGQISHVQMMRYSTVFIVNK